MTQLRERLINRVKEAGPFAEPSEIVDVLHLVEVIAAADAMAWTLEDMLRESELWYRWRAAREKVLG